MIEKMKLANTKPQKQKWNLDCPLGAKEKKSSNDNSNFRGSHSFVESVVANSNSQKLYAQHLLSNFQWVTVGLMRELYASHFWEEKHASRKNWLHYMWIESHRQ
jgi:hypothetical protein